MMSSGHICVCEEGARGNFATPLVLKMVFIMTSLKRLL